MKEAHIFGDKTEGFRKTCYFSFILKTLSILYRIKRTVVITASFILLFSRKLFFKFVNFKCYYSFRIRLGRWLRLETALVTIFGECN